MICYLAVARFAIHREERRIRACLDMARVGRCARHSATGDTSGGDRARSARRQAQPR